MAYLATSNSDACSLTELGFALEDSFFKFLNGQNAAYFIKKSNKLNYDLIHGSDQNQNKGRIHEN